jgi:hypothetical protein
MKKSAFIATLCVAAGSLGAQNPSPTTSITVNGEVGDTTVYFEPTGRPCFGLSHGRSIRAVAIKSDLYVRGMVTPDSAKAIAICNVPGQISSGNMESDDTRTVYEISVLPTNKKTYSKVIVDANTGAVLSTKQFGGARGYAGFLRESAKRRQNKGR